VSASIFAIEILANSSAYSATVKTYVDRFLTILALILALISVCPESVKMFV